MTTITMGARASVTVTLEVHSRGHWGQDATVAEVMRVGGKETLQAIDNLIQAAQQKGVTIRRVGEPKVGAITWEKIE